MIASFFPIGLELCCEFWAQIFHFELPALMGNFAIKLLHLCCCLGEVYYCSKGMRVWMCLSVCGDEWERQGLYVTVSQSPLEISGVQNRTKIIVVLHSKNAGLLSTQELGQTQPLGCKFPYAGLFQTKILDCLTHFLG